MFRLIYQQSGSIARFGLSERGLHVTSPAFAEPLRKKKAIDPSTTKKQYERKVRRLEKEINKLESIDPKLKPILELQLPPQVKKELDARKRSEVDKNIHSLLNAYLKVWSIYKTIETKSELYHIANAARAQEGALNVLKRDYPKLYTAAIQIDPSLLPYTVLNVKKDTPPADSYTCPDGKEVDITKEWKL
ncbi:39S ribosomal protein L40, mitochondrial [Tyrophagus putrescentiae]|nr:39S ribosomal protein L40, mitochondrial [Tyrophagus putrescentiae]